jgi:hypothetical protein
MYDAVYESTDKPSDLVINDDDMLDGWFVTQRQKAKADAAEREVESLTGKLGNAQEVFLQASSIDDIERIKTLNNLNAQVIKKQRSDVIRQKGVAKDIDFLDKKLEIAEQLRHQ